MKRYTEGPRAMKFFSYKLFKSLLTDSWDLVFSSSPNLLLAARASHASSVLLHRSQSSTRCQVSVLLNTAETLQANLAEV